MSIYEQDQRQRENEERLQKMRQEAIRNNDAMTYNTISLYERSGRDVAVLIREIKRLYDETNRLGGL